MRGIRAADVTRPLFGAASAQLPRLARSAGLPFTPPVEPLPDVTEGLAVLEREDRAFDVARIRLWMAEAGETSADELERALTTFEEVDARPYLERCRRGRRRRP
jgi:hypothetical protein